MIPAKKRNSVSNGPNPNLPSYEELAGRLKSLEKDLDRRQESYITREAAFKNKIDELEREILKNRNEKIAWMEQSSNGIVEDAAADAETNITKPRTKFSDFKKLQDQIIKNVETVQDKADRVLKEQERDLSRQFQAKLFDLQAELEREKSKGDNGSIAWIQKCKRLDAEMDWTREMSLKLEETNNVLTRENERLKAQFASHEDDRNFLVKQVTAAKKECIRLKAEYASLEFETEKLRKETSAPVSKTLLQSKHADFNVASSNSQQNVQPEIVTDDKYETDEKYKEINARLRRMLAEERRALQTVRENYSNELKSRTELELVLRACLDDLRREMVLKATQDEIAALTLDLTHEQGMTGTGRPSSSNTVNRRRIRSMVKQARQPAEPKRAQDIGLDTSESRQKFLQMLLSQEKVIKLLYEKALPIHNQHEVNGSSKNTTEDQDAQNESVAAVGLLSRESKEDYNNGTLPKLVVDTHEQLKSSLLISDSLNSL